MIFASIAQLVPDAIFLLFFSIIRVSTSIGLSVTVTLQISLNSPSLVFAVIVISLSAVSPIAVIIPFSSTLTFSGSELDHKISFS